jgi:membrane-associated protease RseP (regulator of RpoE activity)
VAGWLVIVLFIVAILLVVLVHESGHFFTAKGFGIKVEEFFVGFGPRLWSTRRGETEYGIKALPLGGYVRIAGMNPFQEPTPEDRPRTFGAKPIWQRAIVILAGPGTHFVMSVLALAIFYIAVGVPVDYRPSIDFVERTLNGEPSPAVTAGLRPGDVIVAVDGVPVDAPDDPNQAGDDFVTYTRAHVGEPIEITVRRVDETLTVTATPVLAPVDGEQVGRLGVGLGVVSARRDRSDPFTAGGRGVSETASLAKAIFLQLGDVFGPAGLRRIGELLAGAERRPDDVTSVVGAARIAGQAAEAGAWEALFRLFILFNVFVGILNLVPLPPLDGGHLAVLAYEKVTRRKPDLRKLVPLTALVAAFMILFALAVMYLDFVRPLPDPFR